MPEGSWPARAVTRKPQDSVVAILAADTFIQSGLGSAGRPPAFQYQIEFDRMVQPSTRPPEGPAFIGSCILGTDDKVLWSRSAMSSLYGIAV